MEKYYTIFDIINGLKPEYLKTKEELESLKKLLKICNKNINVDFYLQTFAGIDHPNILYFMHKTGLIDVLTNGMFGRGISYKFPMHVIKNNDVYRIPEESVFIMDSALFSSKIDGILNCDFTQNIGFKKSIGNFEIDIDGNYINFSNGMHSLMYPVNSEEYSIPSSKVGLLSYEIAQSELPEYHVSMIEKNKCLKKIR